jgi:hypothetical protein
MRTSEREEALRRLKDPRPPLHWGQFSTIEQLNAATPTFAVPVAAGDTAVVADHEYRTYCYVGPMAGGWVALGYESRDA